jgi:hypothetical protein
MTPFVLRPFFIRSVLATGLIVGAAFALYARRAPMCVNAPQVVAADTLPSTEPEKEDSLAKLDEADEPANDHEEEDTTYFVVIEQATDGCDYYSSFTTDSVDLAAGTQLAVYERDFEFEDGCKWRSEERLTRTDEDTFRYKYREHMVSCPAGHHPAAACTRSGVAVRELGD